MKITTKQLTNKLWCNKEKGQENVIISKREMKITWTRLVALEI